jgi:hypothetical protein
MTTYAVRGDVDLTKLSGFPLNRSPGDHWNPRSWNDQATDAELQSLIEWLSEERDIWSSLDEHSDEARRIRAIIDDLASWRNSGATHRSRISYLYSSTGKPGIAGFNALEWLYFYYLNAEGTTITEITNAFR